LRDAYGLHGLLEELGVVPLTRAQLNGEWEASAVANKVELAAQPATRPAEGMVLRFLGAPPFPAPAAARVARTELPSRHHRSRSILPAASSSACSRLTIPLKVPSFDHLLKRS